jgi:hypothetical protein
MSGGAKKRFPGGGVQQPGGGVRQFVPPRYGGPEIKPGDLRACRHCDQAG